MASSWPSHQLFGDIPAPRNTKERILFVAIDLFYTHGFHGVGLDQILETAGLTKTTFYNHFESKDALAQAAIALQDEWEATAFQRALHEKAGYDPKALLLAGFDVLDDWFNDPRYQGCLFLMAMADYPLPHHPVHRAAARHFTVSREDLTKMATAAGAREPDALASQLTQLLLGATAAFLVDREASAARTARQIAESILKSHLDSA